MPVKQPPYDQDEDLKVSLAVENDVDAGVDPIDLNVEITRPSGSVDAVALGGMTRIATGAYRFTYRIPAESGIYHGVAYTDLPGGSRVREQFDFPVQKPKVGP